MSPNKPQLKHALAALLLASLAGCGTDPVSPATTPDGSVVPDASTPDAPVTADVPAMADAPVTPDVPATPDVAVTPDVPAADVTEPPLMTDSCDAFRAGTVTGFNVDGAPREFILTLPSGATAPGGRWPVVFNWHGLGDTARNFNGLLSPLVGNATMPFILVTPESTHLGPTTAPPGLDWDQLSVTGPNREARLFDAALRCLDERYGIDRDRVYTVGFSAGAIMSDLLGVLRGDQLAAVVSFSGGYFANPANPETLGILRSFVSWPDLTTRNPYPQLLVSGGTTDTFNLFVATARFNVFAANDNTWLRARGHDVIACDHGRGHTVPTALMGQRIVEFFSAHPRGVAGSPWAAGLPSGYPDYCTFQGRGAM